MSRWTILRITVYIATTRSVCLPAVRLSRCGAVARDALGTGDAVALRVVDAELAHHPKHRLGLDPLGHGRNAHRAAHPADRGNHGAVDRVAGEVAHELAVDLEEVHRQVFEVAEGANPRPEVVQREAAAEAAQ